MIKKTPWIERKFNFDFPVSHFPVIVERMRGTPARIEDMVKNISDEKLRSKKENTWSIKEHIGHLNDLEELHEKRLQEYLDGNDKLTPADMTNAKTYGAGYNDKPITDLLEELRGTRNLFIKKIEHLNEEQLNRIALHPRLQQRIRLVDMFFFVAEHDDQHITTMRE
ncbi:MAG TPA: DinB family protein, partial [Bacteroidia bacterium]|nr:DinB family protein [Bacteroidia bacterium]